MLWHQSVKPPSTIYSQVELFLRRLPTTRYLDSTTNSAIVIVRTIRNKSNVDHKGYPVQATSRYMSFASFTDSWLLFLVKNWTFGRQLVDPDVVDLVEANHEALYINLIFPIVSIRSPRRSCVHRLGRSHCFLLSHQILQSSGNDALGRDGRVWVCKETNEVLAQSSVIFDDLLFRLTSHKAISFKGKSRPSKL